MSMRLDWDTARDADVVDAWGTITLVVISLVLSVQEFQGADLSMLMLDFRALPDEAWRHLTTNVMHGGWLHLGMNVLWMLQLGTLVEAMFGLAAYVVLVVLLAAVSSMAQWAFSGPGIGLSGIVYGLFGVLWALDRWHPACRGVMSKRTAEFFGAWFVFCIVITWMDLMPIGNAAHGSGFVFGALTGWALAVGGGRRLARLGIVLATLTLLVGLQAPAARSVVNRSDAYERELALRIGDAIEDEDQQRARELYGRLRDRGSRYVEYFFFAPSGDALHNRSE